jgi:hypothetical protein
MFILYRHKQASSSGQIQDRRKFRGGKDMPAKPGEFIQATFRGQVVEPRETIALFLGMVLTFLVPQLYGFWLVIDGYEKYGPKAALARSSPWLLFSLLAFGLWLSYLFIRLREARFSLSVYKSGLRVVKAGFLFRSHSRFIPWEQISGIAIKAYGSQLKEMTDNPTVVIRKAMICFSDHKPIRLCEARSTRSIHPGYNRLNHLTDLVTRLKASYYPRIFPVLMSRFHQKETLNFGRIQVNQGGIQFRRPGIIPSHSTIPWNQVRFMTIQSGCLVIELTNRKGYTSYLRYPVYRIPNLELLLQVIDQGTG